MYYSQEDYTEIINHINDAIDSLDILKSQLLSGNLYENWLDRHINSINLDISLAVNIMKLSMKD
jgi:uncharacterized LabA/DUF88 family protein